MTPLTYTESPPPSALAPFVRTLWRLRSRDVGPPSHRVEPIFPDGCVELVFHLADPFLAELPGGSLVRQTSALLVGPSSRPVRVARGAESDVYGIRFEPGGASALGLPPLVELRDTIVALEDVGLSRLTSLRDHLGSFERLTRALLDRCTDRGSSSATVRALRATHSIVLAANASGLSTRQLERTFARDVGLAPRLLRGVERFQAALRLLEAGGRRHADVAQLAGYSDEPHFSREFKRFAGMTPGEFERSRAPLTAAFIASE